MTERRLGLPSWWSAVPLELTYQELVGLWGAAHVYRPDATLVEQLHLPADARQVLSEVGLPIHEPWLGSDPGYARRGQLPRPVEVPGRPGRWCLLAEDGGRNWSVAEQSGEVVLLSLDPSSPDHFVNSSLRVFVEFLYRLELWGRHTRRLAALQAGQELVRLWTAIHGIDPPAFQDPDHVWPAFLVDLGWQLGWPLDLPPQLPGTASWQ